MENMRPPAPDQTGLRNPRPGSRTITTTIGGHLRGIFTRVGLTVDDAIEEELADYQRGRAGLTDDETALYAAGQPDVVLWEGERCLAVIRPRPGGDPEVTRLDGGEDGYPLPLPSTEGERLVWGLVKHYGAEACRVAIVDKLLPNFGPPAPRSLTKAEESVLFFVRELGERAALDRLHLAGEYGVIHEAFRRLGADAIGELKRIITTGNLSSEAQEISS